MPSRAERAPNKTDLPGLADRRADLIISIRAVETARIVCCREPLAMLRGGRRSALPGLRLSGGGVGKGSHRRAVGLMARGATDQGIGFHGVRLSLTRAEVCCG